MLGAELFQPHFGDLFFAGALGDLGAVRYRARRHFLELRHDALQLGQMITGASGTGRIQGGDARWHGARGRGGRGRQFIQGNLEDQIVRARIDGQAGLVILEGKNAGLEAEAQLTLFEHLAVLVAEDRQEDFVFEFLL
jgi:hypothetical protein